MTLFFRIKIFTMGMQNMKFIVYIDKVMRFIFQQLQSLKDSETIKNENINAILLLLITPKNHQLQHYCCLGIKIAE